MKAGPTWGYKCVCGDRYTYYPLVYTCIYVCVCIYAISVYTFRYVYK